MNGAQYLEMWGSDDPDMVGASEYRAIHEVVADGITSMEEGDGDPKDMALSMLDEIIDYALAMRNRIKRAKPICAECRQPIGRRRSTTAKDGAVFHSRCWNNA